MFNPRADWLARNGECDDRLAILHLGGVPSTTTDAEVQGAPSHEGRGGGPRRGAGGGAFPGSTDGGQGLSDKT